jgi:CrcB protein
MLVGLGGMLGALARHGIGIGTVKLFQSDLPIGTFVANVIGCFLIGVLIGSDVGEAQPKLKLMFGVGFLGSLTTFSTFSAETIQQASQGNWSIAGGNLLANLLIGFGAVMFGMAIGKKFLA